MKIFADKPTSRKCGEQEDTSVHLLFDWEICKQVRLTTLGLVSKGSGILQENIVGCVLQFCRLMDPSTVQG